MSENMKIRIMGSLMTELWIIMILWMVQCPC